MLASHPSTHIEAVTRTQSPGKERPNSCNTPRIAAKSARAVVDAMSDDDLAAPVELYGRQVASWAVLLQLVTHMNEHLGQSIAYARMNGVVPPWSSWNCKPDFT